MAFGTRPTCGAAAHPVQVGTVNNAKVTVQAIGTTMRPTRTSMPNKRGENVICTGDESAADARQCSGASATGVVRRRQQRGSQLERRK